MVIGLSVSIAVNLILGVILYRLQTDKKRSDVAQIAKALQDFQTRKGCIVEIRRLEPDDLLVWKSR